MRAYLFKRIIAMLLTILSLATGLFFLIRLAPGDPASIFIAENLPQEDIISIREDWGLDQSILSQYVSYIGNLATLDFGVSFKHRRPVTEVIGESLLNSVVLLVPSLAIMTILGVVIGAVAGWKRNSIFEKTVVLVSLVGRGMPSFFIGMLLLLFLAYQRSIFPPGGMISPGTFGSTWSLLATLDLWRHLALPSLAVALSGLYGPLLLMRTSIIEFKGEDFVEVLEAKGLRQRRIIFHAARNGMLPVLTSTAITFAFVLDGQVVIEQVFSWPGAGRLIVQSMIDRDYPVLQSMFLLTAVGVVVMNLVADLMYRWFDPRVKYE